MKTIFSMLVLMLVSVAPSFAATVASLHGSYAFQVSDAGTIGGDTGTNNTKVVSRVTVGVISFNGAGLAKFTELTKEYSDTTGTGGPVVNVNYKYTVSGNTANLVIPGKNGATIVLSLGAFNASGVAQVALVLVPKADEEGAEALSGIAILQ